MKTYDITISHNEKIVADSLENARDKFNASYNPQIFLNNITEITHQMTIDEINENRMKFGSDERKTALGRKFALRTVASINQDIQAISEDSKVSETLSMIQDSLDNWMKKAKPRKNWIDKEFADKYTGEEREEWFEKQVIEIKKPLNEKDIEWLKEHKSRFLPKHQSILDSLSPEEEQNKSASEEELAV